MVATSKNSGWLQEGVIRGSMLGKTMLPTDEELGKKDDDHNFKPARRHHHNTAGWTHGPRWRRKRVLLVVLGFVLFTVVMHQMRSERPEPTLSAHHSPFTYTKPTTGSGDEGRTSSGELKEPKGPPPGIRAPKRGEQPSHTFDGQYKFYRLAKSLRGAAHTDGYRRVNRNVLFAVSSLQSAATMLPLICEMSKWNRNWVHAAFMGREDVPLAVILDINGIDTKSCPAIWHDARPDYSQYSTEDRAEQVAQSALSHIQNFLHPQVAIMDDATSEDAFFVAGMRNKTETLDIPLIEVPKGKWEEYMWMTRLDAGSLRSWHTPTVDIMVQVPPDSSSVLHLLRSISQADYKGLGYPRITLELPTDLDPVVERSLENFQWPPHTPPGAQGSQLVLRRRIASHRATQEEAAIRFLELFYPSNVATSHMLLLSPQVQLSPQYFHYIKYMLLEYRYSSFAIDTNDAIMGASLSLPSLLIDGKTKLTPPTARDMHAERYLKPSDNKSPVPFLMQAPNPHATLFFGDKWSELHSFLRHRVSFLHQKGTKKTAARPKLVSETLPSWTEYALEFMRARGYALVYPGLTSADALATVHNEMYRAPEEYTEPQSLASDGENDKETPPKADLTEPFLREATPPSPPKNLERPLVSHASPLHKILPFDADLPEAEHFPHLLFNGVKMDPSSVGQVAGKYANVFREDVGGCVVPKGKKRVWMSGSAEDLFCAKGMGEGGWEEDWTVDRTERPVGASATASTTMSVTASAVGSPSAVGKEV